MPTDDMVGKIVLVTGSSSGLGLETAKQLHSRGATIILTCRDEQKGQHALNVVKSSCSNGEVHLFQVDLLCYASILKFCANVRSTFSKLDVLVCNAGVMGLPFELSADGIECHFATNQFSHFVIVNQLLPLLEVAGGRIVIVSSGFYKMADDLPTLRQIMGEQLWDYDSKKAYAVSKLANILYAVELARKLQECKSSVKVYALRPGFVRGTDLGRETHWLLRKLAAPIILFVAQSLEAGVSTMVHLSSVSADELNTGKLYYNCREEDPTELVTNYRASQLYEICSQMEDIILKRSDLTENERQQAVEMRSWQSLFQD